MCRTAFTVFPTVFALLLAATFPPDLYPLPPGPGWEERPYRRWRNGPPDDPGFFPVAVWLQNPRNAARYREAGFNVYVGLWRGPTEEQLRQLRDAGMRVICVQNETGLRHLDDPTIIGWMHEDEPDNAQPLPGGRGYGPPIPPEEIVRRYREMRAADPTRPILLNLGQGVAWDEWHGRGVRSRHPEDYPRYVAGCDIVSFDIYPVVHRDPRVAGQLWFVPYGVTRLRKWTGDSKVVWNCIECSRISNPDRKPTPVEVRAEVWMSLVFGSRGLIYFVHQFEPRFDEASLLHDSELLAAVTELNRQIHELAPVLNSRPLLGEVSLVEAGESRPIRFTVRRTGEAVYLFAVSLADHPARARFRLEGASRGAKRVTVLYEGRGIDVHSGLFEDSFGPYDVHLYRVPLE